MSEGYASPREEQDRPLDLCKDICSERRGVPPEILQEVIFLAVEIAREGREGRKIGTMFTVGDLENVLERSRCLILDPLLGHPRAVKQIMDPNMRETIKELAQLDGAFLVCDSGVVHSAARYINANTEGIVLPLGLGSRHVAAASITKDTAAVAVVVSESSMVRVFDDGEIISEIIPEVWMLSRYSPHLTGRVATRQGENLTVVSRVDA
jgi:diadenylate cyclase